MSETKWARERAAHAAGLRIQGRFAYDGSLATREWKDLDEPRWLDDERQEYRIHPDDEAKSAQQAIPHADIIRAVLDGKVVQSKANEVDDWSGYASWQDVLRDLLKFPCWQYRIKPEPVVRWGPVIGSTRIFGLNMSNTKAEAVQSNPDSKQVYRTEWIGDRCVSISLEDV